jgi:hypothetical protein
VRLQVILDYWKVDVSSYLVSAVFPSVVRCSYFQAADFPRIQKTRSINTSIKSQYREDSKLRGEAQ